jgi:hypothetical protein
MIRTVLGGYLPGTNSCRYHPITNLKIKENPLWEYFDIIMNDKVVTTIENTNSNKSYAVEINRNNTSYDLNLEVNNKEIYKASQLYCFKVNLHLTKIIFDNVDFIEPQSSYIYDC